MFASDYCLHNQLKIHKVKATLFFVVQAVERIISGWLVGKIIILILNFRFGLSKSKNIDDGVKETCAIMLRKVTYEVNHISLLWDSTISSALDFLFVMYFSVI